MADNIQLNAGCGGAVLATDCIACVQYQIMKVSFGALNTATAVTACAPLPVDIRAENASVTVDNAGTFAVQVDGDALTALQLIDNPVLVDDAAFTPATSSVMMAGFEFDDTTPDSVDEGDAGAARMSANRNIYVQLRDAAGNERGLNIDACGFAGVTNAGLTELAAAINCSQLDINLAASAATVTVDLGANNDVTIDGSSIVKAEDAVHSTGDAGVMALTVRDDVPASTAGAENDYAPLLTDSNGRLHTNVVFDASKISYKGKEYAPTFVNVSHSCSTFNIVAGCSVGACQSAILFQMVLVSTGAVNAHFTDTCACPSNLFGDATNVIELTCSSGFTLPFSPVGWMKSTAGDGIEMNLSSACVPVAGMALVAVVCN